jgi:hypothetical protein
LSRLSELEVSGVSSIPVQIQKEINHFDTWVVLSNNSSSCIRKSIARSAELHGPQLILAREQIQGTKSDFDIFSKAITQICSELHWELDAITYWGDQDYEITFARSLGIEHTEKRLLGKA